MQQLVFRAGHDNYQFFTESICDQFFRVDPPESPPPNFDLRFQFAQLQNGALGFIENHGDDFEIVRTAARIALESGPLEWVLGVCVKGRGITTSAAGCEVTEAGGLRLNDTQTPHAVKIPAGARLGLLRISDLVARASCDTRAWSVRSLPQTPIGRILATHLMSIFDELDDLEPRDAEQVVASVVPLLDAVLARTSSSVERAQPSLRSLRRRSVIRFIEAHVADPRLRAAWIAKSLGISPRYLHALFDEQERSIGEMILVARLIKCREAILDRRNASHSITDIAYRFGFSSSSHFSRAFRRHFGISPSELRRDDT